MNTARLNTSLRIDSATHRSRRGFTLIEMLIVVAILAILAAIGLVNLQAAQVRSKCARVKSDMRTLALALESYRVDQHAYPPAAIGDIPRDDPLRVLTSPVSYLTSIPRDPFGLAPFNFNPNILMLGYHYIDRVTTSVGMPGETYGHVWKDVPNKEYLLHSCGPNRVWNVIPWSEYDPTNGVVSAGDVIRFGPF